jgi:hypothetical protein
MVLLDIMVHAVFMWMGYTLRHVVDSHVVHHWGVLDYLRMVDILSWCK